MRLSPIPIPEALRRPPVRRRIAAEEARRSGESEMVAVARSDRGLLGVKERRRCPE